MKKKTTVSKTTQIGEVLNMNPNVKDILMGFGLHCFGCPMSQMETVEQAAMAHGVDVEFMMATLDRDLVENKKKRTCCKKSK